MMKENCKRFYGELLGWEMCELFARPAVSSSSGIVFIEEKDYVPPVWPEDTGKTTKNRCILIFRLIMLQKWLSLGIISGRTSVLYAGSDNSSL